MKTKLICLVLLAFSVGFFGTKATAQDLGPHFKKIKDGIFVYAEKPADSNATIILTSEGVVMIDSGHRPPDSVALAEALKKSSDARSPVKLM